MFPHGISPYQFVKSSEEICRSLQRCGFWVDFIDPFSGTPVGLFVAQHYIHCPCLVLPVLWRAHKRYSFWDRPSDAQFRITNSRSRLLQGALSPTLEGERVHRGDLYQRAFQSSNTHSVFLNAPISSVLYICFSEDGSLRFVVSASPASCSREIITLLFFINI